MLRDSRDALTTMYISSKIDKAVCSSWVVVEFTEDDAPEAALDEPNAVANRKAKCASSNAVAGALRCQPVQRKTSYWTGT